ncbi:MAG: hypothetical protein ACI9XU_000010 [Arenicella sp.]
MTLKLLQNIIACAIAAALLSNGIIKIRKDPSNTPLARSLGVE